MRRLGAWIVMGLVGLVAQGGEGSAGGPLPEGVAALEVEAPVLVVVGAPFTVRVTVTADEGWTASPVASLAPREGEAHLRLRAPSASPSDATLVVEQPLSIERAGAQALKLRLTVPMCRSDRCFVRALDVTRAIEAVGGERPGDVLRKLVERRLALGRAQLRRCVYQAVPHAPSPASVTVSVSGGGDALQVAAQSRDAVAAAVEGCAQELLGDQYVSGEVPAATVVVTVARERRTGEGMRGRRGDVCQIGEHMLREEPWVELSTPAPCGPGLRCCTSGGAYGSSSVCMATPVCPLLP